MNKIRFIVMLTLTVAFLSLLAAVPAVAGKTLHHASGSGFFHVLDSSSNRNDMMFKFNAHQMKPKHIANGHMQFHNLTKGIDYKLEIVYMEVVEGSVWLEGIVTKSNNDKVFPGESKCVLFVDNGEGMHAPPDESSKLTNCGTALNFNLETFPLDGGNIQVR